MPKKIPVRDYDEIYQYYIVENHSLKETANFFNIGNTLLLTWLKFYHIKKPKREMPKISKEEIIEKYIVQNRSIVSLCLEYGVGRSWFNKILKKYKIKKSIDSVVDLRKKTCEEIYGATTPLKNEEIKKKIKRTTIENYGVENPSKSEKIKEKKKKTYFDKYGANSPLQVKAFRDKAVNTMKDRYGTTAWKKTLIPSNVLEILDSKEKLKNFILNSGFKNIQYLAKELKASEVTLSRRIKEFNLSYLLENSSSYPEKEIKDFLLSIGVKCEKDRTEIFPKEIDLYNRELRVGIEFNGSYWHQEEKLGSQYHKDKTRLCKEKGIFLIHLFDWDWNSEEAKNKTKKYLISVFNQTVIDVIGKKIEFCLKEKKEIISDVSKENDLWYEHFGLTIEKEISPLRHEFNIGRDTEKLVTVYDCGYKKWI